jgi:hypothetical protein
MSRVLALALVVGLSSCTEDTPGYCKDDSDCPIGMRCEIRRHYCISATDASTRLDAKLDASGDVGPGLEIGVACSDGKACASGFCVDGVCCEEACDQVCETCKPAGLPGRCRHVAGDTDPHHDCKGDYSICSGTCDGYGKCSYPPAGTWCGFAHCLAGGVLSKPRCDGKGACVVDKTPCAPFPCDAGAETCNKSCDPSSLPCPSSSVCFQSSCHQLHAVTSPTTNDLTGLARFKGTVWAIGHKGTVLEYDGKQWSTVSTGYTEDLHGATVDGNTLWIVGKKGRVLRFEGNSWTSPSVLPTVDLTAVWVSPNHEPWVVGNTTTSAVVYRRDGSSWKWMHEVSGVRFLSIDGSSGTDVWVGGSGGAMWRHDGKSWTKVATPLAVPVTSIRFPFAVGGGTTGTNDPVINYSGGKWSLVVGKQTPIAMRLFGLDLYASGAVVVGDHVGVMYPGSGKIWHSFKTPAPKTLRAARYEQFKSTWWIVGDKGSIYRLE